MFIGDVGQSSREEIDVQKASSPGGGENYGWRVREGFIQNPAYPTIRHRPMQSIQFSSVRTTGQTIIVVMYIAGVGFRVKRYLCVRRLPQTGRWSVPGEFGSSVMTDEKSRDFGISLAVFSERIHNFQSNNPSSLGENAEANSTAATSPTGKSTRLSFRTLTFNFSYRRTHSLSHPWEKRERWKICFSRTIIRLRP